MTETTFIEQITAMRIYMRKVKKLQKVLSKFTSINPVFIDGHASLIKHQIQNIVILTGNYVYWYDIILDFMWEEDRSLVVANLNGKEYTIETAKELYDFLIQNFTEKSNAYKELCESNQSTIQTGV